MRRTLPMLSAVLLLAAAAFAAEPAAPPAPAAFTVDAAYPGGNIIVDKIEGDTVSLQQDLRDTQKGQWWFYWNFRVRGAAGRTLTFKFTNKDPIGVRGPAVSTDAGLTWTWLGLEKVKGASFQYAFPADAAEVRFAMAIPYQESDLKRFLERHKNDPHLKADELCRTPKGRPVERLRVGKLTGEPDLRILLTSRHHCCESLATFAMEGFLETAMSDSDDGRWYQGHVEILAIPLVDKDGVEDGDQGKFRAPRDHNRDYDGKSLYASTAAIREFVPKWSAGRLRLALDLHCPYLKGGATNERIYFVGSPEKDNWERALQLAKILEETQTGPLEYRTADNVPYGTSWNTSKNFTAGLSFGSWARTLPGVRAAASLEIPYATARGGVVTADSARAFGRDLARAVRKYLESPEAAASAVPAAAAPAK